MFLERYSCYITLPVVLKVTMVVRKVLDNSLVNEVIREIQVPVHTFVQFYALSGEICSQQNHLSGIG